jgi:hypothetical protein
VRGKVGVGDSVCVEEWVDKGIDARARTSVCGVNECACACATERRTLVTR